MKIRRITKVRPFGRMNTKCICGVRLEDGRCSHCDGTCILMTTSDKACRRCKKADYALFVRNYIEDNYFVAFELETENKKQALFKEAEKARYREEHGFGEE